MSLCPPERKPPHPPTPPHRVVKAQGVCKCWQRRGKKPWEGHLSEWRADKCSAVQTGNYGGGLRRRSVLSGKVLLLMIWPLTSLPRAVRLILSLLLRAIRWTERRQREATREVRLFQKLRVTIHETASQPLSLCLNDKNGFPFCFMRHMHIQLLLADRSTD